MSNEEIIENISHYTGYLYSKDQVIEAINKARIDTIKQCAERARIQSNSVAESILILIDEL